jgi:hypothetical protein
VQHLLQQSLRTPSSNRDAARASASRGTVPGTSTLTSRDVDVTKSIDTQNSSWHSSTRRYSMPKKCVYVYMYVCVCARASGRLPLGGEGVYVVCVCVCLCVCVCVCVYVCVCVLVDTYTYTYTYTAVSHEEDAARAIDWTKIHPIQYSCRRSAPLPGKIKKNITKILERQCPSIFTI